ncbi:hypothetical protein [Bacteroides thetaiotaomicron]|uniref:hypothetical protein n=1 Tax=Bacteroides thetaiotaomicron TaxID=818 RepID=UPI002165B921|nr:hypothetical protein [Bacteroides thetaiotaomicron]MCS3198547.1 hypothetical protein [Bacteroides thetaiotaomicron]
MRLQIKTYMLFWLLLCMVSCVQEEVASLVPAEEVDQVSIELFTRLRSYDTPVSRAEAEEDEVSKDPWILVFTDVGGGVSDNAVFAEAAQANINVGNKSYVLLKPQNVTSWILILANPQEKFYIGNMAYDFSIDNFNNRFTGQTLASVTSQISAIPMSTVNEPPFVGKTLPMSYLYEATGGINVNTKIGTSDVPLELTRAVAKIVVKSNTADFTLLGVHSVYNMNKNTVLHNLSSVPETATNVLDYIKSDTDEDFVFATINIADPIYVYEAEANSNTYMIIHGLYKGTEYYYKMAIADSDFNYMDIKRNHEYEFTIVSANSPGFATYADALLSKPNNMNLKHEVKITDLASYEIKANSEYFLAVSNRLCIIYDDTESSGNQYIAFTLTTDCTYAHRFSDESNYLKVSNGAMSIVSPTPARIPSAANANSPVTTDVIVKLPAGSADKSTINIKLGNIEQTVNVVRKSIIPVGGAVVNYYTENAGTYDFEYYLLTAKVDNSAPWITMKNKYGVTSADPNSIMVEDGVIDIHVASTSVARNTVIYLTTIKNPNKPLEDDKDMPRRIKAYLYQKGY